VGFRRGATPEVLDDTGVLVAPDDLLGAARACVALLTDERRRIELLRSGRERVLTNFSAQTSGAIGASALRAAFQRPRRSL
jgi:glycosyltransferase involved in cell wall biosynthesis